MPKEISLSAIRTELLKHRNEYGQFFEKERFLKVLSRIKNYSFENIGVAIIEAVDDFVGDSPVVDDLSLIIIRKD